MIYQIIITGRSVNALKFDDMGLIQVDEGGLEDFVNQCAVRVFQQKRRRKVVHAFRYDEDQSCYSAEYRNGQLSFSRNYEGAKDYKRSQSQIDKTLEKKVVTV